MDKPKCLICKERDVYLIKSHLTPRAISENTYGPKDKEEIYEINPQTGQHDVFMGREHPEAVPDEIKPQPNVEKGIFCKQCEEALGRLESVCQPILLEAISKLGKSEMKITRLGGAKTFTVQIPSNVLKIFLYSILWRQALEQKRGGQDNPLSEAEFEQLREILKNEIHKKITEIENSPTFEFYPAITLFTTYFRDEFKGFNNPHPIVTNPEVYFISEYVCLYFKDQNISSDLEKKIGLPPFLHTPIFSIHGAKESVIAVLNEREFDRLFSIFIQKVAKDFRKTHILKVAKARNLSFFQSSILLEQLTYEIGGYKMGEGECFKAFILASEKLCS